MTLTAEKGIPVTYRAGDQPNNALSLNVFNPGDIAATAGTSGVVYGVSGKPVRLFAENNSVKFTDLAEFTN